MAYINPALGGEVVTSCNSSGSGNIMAVVVDYNAQQLAIGVTATSAATPTKTSVSCITAAGKTITVPLDIEEPGGPQIGEILQGGLNGDGSITFTITGTYFGDSRGTVTIAGPGSPVAPVQTWDANDPEDGDSYSQDTVVVWVYGLPTVCDSNNDSYPYQLTLITADPYFNDSEAESSFIYSPCSEYPPAAPPPPPAPTVTVTANGAQVQPGSCAYISAAPQMPQILATVSNNGTTPPPGDTVAWQLVTTFPRATSSNTAVIDTNSVGANYIPNTSPGTQFGPNGPSQSAPPPQGTLATPVSQPANCAWAPWQAPAPGTSGQPSNCPAGNSGAAPAFFGGYATINWSYNGNAEQPFNFHVCGTNAGNTYTNNGAQPSAEQTYMQQTPPTSSYWFPWYIALHETNASQFCQSGRSAPPPYCSQQFNWGFPVWGYPSGYGMMQIDPPPSQTLLWNWQADVQQAGTKLGSTAGPGFWNTQVTQFNAYNQGQAAAGLPPVPPPPDQQEGACTFTLPMSAGQGVSGSIAGGGATNTYWFADAIQLRNYNGGAFSYGGVTVAPNYISWQANSPSIGYWRIFKPNTVNSDIVADVCACIPGSTSASPPNSTCGHNASVPAPWLMAPTNITPSTQTPGAWTVQFTLSGLPGYVALTSSNPSIFPLPFSQFLVSAVTTFAFDVVPGAVTAPTLIQVTASIAGTTATASVVLQPQQ